MIGIIILSVLLTLSVAFFIVYYKQIGEVNALYLSKPEDLDITWDLRIANKFNVPKILYSLEISRGTRLYSINPDEELYLDSYVDINSKKNGRVVVSVTNTKTKQRSTRTYDKYGISIANLEKKRRPGNCEIFLTPKATKMSWYCVINYSRVVVVGKLKDYEEKEIKFPLKVLQSTVNKYCTKYCFLECKKGCALKDAYKINSKSEVLEKIDIYCERDCETKDMCSKSCLLYEIKSR